jgi:hypothetical protein
MDFAKTRAETLNFEREELFKLYVPMAGRITNLRTILQNPLIECEREAAQLWAEDCRSTMQDLMTLLDRTREHLIKTLPLEPVPHDHPLISVP